MILVAGATGRVGSTVVELLRRQGRSVRALCRSELKAMRLREEGVKIAVGGLTERLSLDAACQGVEVIIGVVTALNPRTLGDAYQPEAVEVPLLSDCWPDQRHRASGNSLPFCGLWTDTVCALPAVLHSRTSPGRPSPLRSLSAASAVDPRPNDR